MSRFLTRMKHTVLALVAGAGLLFSHAALAAVSVDLKSELFDSDGRITLGDLFDNAGAVASVSVAPGPQAGTTMVLDAARVQQIAWANGLAWNNPNGFRRLIVKGEAAGSVVAGASNPGKMVDVLTYSRSIAAGEIVEAQDVIWSKVQAHLAPADAARDVERVIGLSARRPLREGAAVASHDLASPQVIAKDDLITVVWNTGGVTLSLQAKAMKSAAVGDSLTVMNTQSKKLIEAVATAPGRAAVGPEAEGLRSNRLAAR
jgi:flagella basal body P-ring formation protein FlgA